MHDLVSRLPGVIHRYAIQVPRVAATRAPSRQPGTVAPPPVVQHSLRLAGQVQRHLAVAQQAAVVVDTWPANIARRVTPNALPTTMGGHVHVPHVTRIITTSATQPAPTAT